MEQFVAEDALGDERALHLKVAARMGGTSNPRH